MEKGARDKMPTKMTRVQEYKARKRKEKMRKRITALVLSAIVLSLTVIALVFGSATKFVEESYIIREGDTLWELYTEYGNGADWDAWLHEMLAVNGIDHNSFLVPGESIIVLTAE